MRDFAISSPRSTTSTARNYYHLEHLCSYQQSRPNIQSLKSAARIPVAKNNKIAARPFDRAKDDFMEKSKDYIPASGRKLFLLHERLENKSTSEEQNDDSDTFNRPKIDKNFRVLYEDFARFQVQWHMFDKPFLGTSII